MLTLTLVPLVTAVNAVTSARGANHNVVTVVVT